MGRYMDIKTVLQCTDLLTVTRCLFILTHQVLSVQPDPARSEVFIINYLEKNKVKQRLTFSRIDRSRDIWVEMLTSPGASRWFSVCDGGPGFLSQ